MGRVFVWREQVVPTGEGVLSGARVAVKDNLAVAGLPTTAGSRVLRDSPPAGRHAEAVRRVLAAGGRVVGRTNMTELAYSGLGQNPHYGTPENPLFPGRLPGGSSSGSATAISLGLVPLAVGTDTGGSVRIPAAFQGLFSLKPTNGLLPTEGLVFLSRTLDVVGPMSRDLDGLWRLFLALLGEEGREMPRALEKKLRLLVPRELTRDLEPEVERAFSALLARLRERGHEVVEEGVAIFTEIEELYRRHGPLVAHEAYREWGELVRERGRLMDPLVARRILAAAAYGEDDYREVLRAHAEWPKRFWREVAGFDALLLPTVPVLPPRVSVLWDPGAFFRTNALVLRNTMPFNFLKGPALNFPLSPGVGATLALAPGEDERAFSLLRAIVT